MTSKKITIVTGEKHGGKTTALQQWRAEKTDVGGFLTPVINGKRVFNNLLANEFFQMEFDDTVAGDVAIEIGKYKFSKQAFKKATHILESCLVLKPSYIIVDELGPLELQQQGFHLPVSLLIRLSPAHLIFVVREELVSSIIDLFKISDANVIQHIKLKDALL